MANRYWVGGTGNWSDTGHWSTTSGGSSGASMPTSADDVFFDENSFTAASQKVTVNITANCHNMDWTGVTNTPQLRISNALYVYGSLVMSSSMTHVATQTLYFNSDTEETILTNGITLRNIGFNGTGIYRLLDNMQCQNISIYTGTFDTMGYDITLAEWNSNQTTPRAVYLRSSIITLSNRWILSSSTSATNSIHFDAGTSKIIMTGDSKDFYGGGVQYHDVEFVGDNITILYGDNTFNDLKFVAGNTVNIKDGTIQTVNTMSGNGTAGNLIVLQSTSSGNAFTIQKTTGKLDLQYYSLKDCTAIGGAAFLSLLAKGCVDDGGNSGWSFTARFWVGGGGDWIDNANHWSATSGGTPGASLPTSSDDVFFDENSFPEGMSDTIWLESGGSGCYCRNMNWAGSDSHLAPILNPTEDPVHIYGNLSLISEMVIGADNGDVFVFTGSGNKTIRVPGQDGIMLHSVRFDDADGVWTLLDHFISTSVIDLRSGTINTNGYHVGCYGITITGSGDCALNLGSSYVLNYGDWVADPDLTLDAGISNMSVYGDFIGCDLTYHNVTMIGAAKTLSGDNTFNSLSIGTGKTVIFEAGSIQTIGTFNIIGTSSLPVTIKSSSSGNPFTITTPSDVFYYLRVEDCTATNAATVYFGRDDGGNTGFTFFSHVFDLLMQGIGTMSASGNLFEVKAITLTGSFENGDTIIIDSENLTITKNGANALDMLTGDFFDLIPGTNKIYYSDEEEERDLHLVLSKRDRWL